MAQSETSTCTGCGARDKVIEEVRLYTQQIRALLSKIDGLLIGPDTTPASSTTGTGGQLLAGSSSTSSSAAASATGLFQQPPALVENVLPEPAAPPPAIAEVDSSSSSPSSSSSISPMHDMHIMGGAAGQGGKRLTDDPFSPEPCLDHSIGEEDIARGRQQVQDKTQRKRRIIAPRKYFVNENEPQKEKPSFEGSRSVAGVVTSGTVDTTAASSSTFSAFSAPPPLNSAKLRFSTQLNEKKIHANVHAANIKNESSTTILPRGAERLESCSCDNSSLVPEGEPLPLLNSTSPVGSSNNAHAQLLAPAGSSSIAPAGSSNIFARKSCTTTSISTATGQVDRNTAEPAGLSSSSQDPQKPIIADAGKAAANEHASARSNSRKDRGGKMKAAAGKVSAAQLSIAAEQQAGLPGSSSSSPFVASSSSSTATTTAKEKQVGKARETSTKRKQGAASSFKPATRAAKKTAAASAKDKINDVASKEGGKKVQVVLESLHKDEDEPEASKRHSSVPPSRRERANQAKNPKELDLPHPKSDDQDKRIRSSSIPAVKGTGGAKTAIQRAFSAVLGELYDTSVSPPQPLGDPGSFGAVFIGCSKTSKQPVAVKLILESGDYKNSHGESVGLCHSDDLDDNYREVVALQRLAREEDRPDELLHAVSIDRFRVVDVTSYFGGKNVKTTTTVLAITMPAVGKAGLLHDEEDAGAAGWKFRITLNKLETQNKGAAAAALLSLISSGLEGLGFLNNRFSVIHFDVSETNLKPVLKLINGKKTMQARLLDYGKLRLLDHVTKVDGESYGNSDFAPAARIGPVSVVRTRPVTASNDYPALSLAVCEYLTGRRLANEAFNFKTDSGQGYDVHRATLEGLAKELAAGAGGRGGQKSAGKIRNHEIRRPATTGEKLKKNATDEQIADFCRKAADEIRDCIPGDSTGTSAALIQEVCDALASLLEGDLPRGVTVLQPTTETEFAELFGVRTRSTDEGKPLAVLRKEAREKLKALLPSDTLLLIGQDGNTKRGPEAEAICRRDGNLVNLQ
ncbi:unnamed protein product [Amoebophrya sp. A120]|nr:unnamed protein product [Amoebophrya sp. A120]|eukprot:GSA120T00001366001.1